MPTLTDLLAVHTQAEVFKKTLDLFRSKGFVVANWASGALARHLAEYQSLYLSSVSKDVAALAAAGFLSTAFGDWLTLVAQEVFQDDRQAATFAEGVVVFEDVSGVGPVTIQPDSYWVQPQGSSVPRFRNTNTTNLVLPGGGSVAVPVRAESPGTLYNVAPGEIRVIAPSLVGVTVSNPVLEGRETWLTTQAVDAEGDDELKPRLRAKWSTLGSGSHRGSYAYWIQKASLEVTRTRIVGDPTTGIVNAWLAGPTGPVSGEAIAAVNAYIEALRPLCSKFLAQNATSHLTPIAGILYADKGVNADALKLAAFLAIRKLASELAIGETVYKAVLVERLMSLPGARNLVLTSPAADVGLTVEEVWVPTLSAANLLVVPVS